MPSRIQNGGGEAIPVFGFKAGKTAIVSCPDRKKSCGTNYPMRLDFSTAAFSPSAMASATGEAFMASKPSAVVPA